MCRATKVMNAFLFDKAIGTQTRIMSQDKLRQVVSDTSRTLGLRSERKRAPAHQPCEPAVKTRTHAQPGKEKKKTFVL
jgi:hypothetical protein